MIFVPGPTLVRERCACFRADADGRARGGRRRHRGGRLTGNGGRLLRRRLRRLDGGCADRGRVGRDRAWGGGWGEGGRGRGGVSVLGGVAGGGRGGRGGRCGRGSFFLLGGRGRGGQPGARARGGRKVW